MNLWYGTEHWETAQEELEAAGVTDGLPVVPPTPGRVERMLKFHDYDPDELIAELPPLCRKATWQDIAINTVMAGGRPEYLPVVGAIAEALAADEFNLMAIATTTGSVAPVVIVNGPIAKEIRMNAAGNALGPGNRANATIGRAVSLMLLNIGGAKPGEFDMATLGQPAKYTCCFAENESTSPWPGLHVERGFAPDSSVVTVVGASGIVEVVDSCSNRPEELAQTFAGSMLIAGTIRSDGLLGGGEPLIIMPPELAEVFEHGGYSKADVQRAIYERAVMPIERLSPAVREYLTTFSGSHGKRDAIAELRVAKQPADVLIVVAGGVGVKAAYVPTWGGGTRAVSRQIRQARVTLGQPTAT
jgi:hypothetical protein